MYHKIHPFTIYCLWTLSKFFGKKILILIKVGETLFE